MLFILYINFPYSTIKKVKAPANLKFMLKKYTLFSLSFQPLYFFRYLFSSGDLRYLFLKLKTFTNIFPLLKKGDIILNFLKH